jgi:hypothetical protein
MFQLRCLSRGVNNAAVKGTFRYDAMVFSGLVPVFWKKLHPPSSGQKMVEDF